mgnify:CR=1 FL=1
MTNFEPLMEIRSQICEADTDLDQMDEVLGGLKIFFLNLEEAEAEEIKDLNLTLEIFFRGCEDEQDLEKIDMRKITTTMNQKKREKNQVLM